MTRILKYVPVKGTKYRNWTVCSDEIIKRKSNRSTYWKVQCKCGKVETRSAHHLVNNKTGACRSCAATKNTFEQHYLNKIERRALISDFEFNLTVDYIKQLIEKQSFKCKLTGFDIKFATDYKNLTKQTASLDRIDSTKGYIKGNVQWLHKDVNFAKHSLTQERFLEICKAVSSSKCG